MATEYDYMYDAYEDDMGDEVNPYLTSLSSLGVDQVETGKETFVPSVERSGCEVLEESAALSKKEEQVSSFSELFQIGKPETHILLSFFKWNGEKLTSAFFDEKQKARLNKMGLACKFAVFPAKADFCCDICLNDVRASDGFSLCCNHVYCNQCWKSHLEINISTKGDDIAINYCPGCKETIVPHSKIKELVSSKIYSRLMTVDLRDFIRTSSSMVMCPNLECKRTFLRTKMHEFGRSNAQCLCDTVFCLDCGMDAHSPLTCVNARLWIEKLTADSANVQWILSNTKRCPKCKHNIEKNEGCNHMTCRCKHQFCWICLKDWSLHNGSLPYDCAKYRAVPMDTMDTEEKREADRFSHYYEHWLLQHDSLKKARLFKEKVQSKMISILAAKSGMHSLSYIEEAYEELYHARSMLKYTIALSFLTKEERNVNTISLAQSQLSLATENLNKSLELPATEISSEDILMKVSQVKNSVQNLLRTAQDVQDVGSR